MSQRASAVVQRPHLHTRWRGAAAGRPVLGPASSGDAAGSYQYPLKPAKREAPDGDTALAARWNAQRRVPLESKGCGIPEGDAIVSSVGWQGPCSISFHDEPAQLDHCAAVGTRAGRHGANLGVVHLWIERPVDRGAVLSLVSTPAARALDGDLLDRAGYGRLPPILRSVVGPFCPDPRGTRRLERFDLPVRVEPNCDGARVA
jgi:hypothetical protein